MEVRCNRNFVENKTLLCCLCFFSLKEQVAIYRQNTRVLEFDTFPSLTWKGGRKDGHVTTTALQRALCAREGFTKNKRYLLSAAVSMIYNSSGGGGGGGNFGQNSLLRMTRWKKILLLASKGRLFPQFSSSVPYRMLSENGTALKQERMK